MKGFKTSSALGRREPDQGKAGTTRGEALRRGRELLAEAGTESADLDAQLLLAHFLNTGREKVLCSGEERLAGEIREFYEAALERRAGGEPLAYLTGRREFWSLDLHVDRRVLIPRPETEILVEAALEFLSPEAKVMEVGTGSGAVSAALAVELPRCDIIATDLSEGALEVAASNFARFGLGQVRLRRGSFYESLLDGDGPFDALLSNPPYIDTAGMADLPREVLFHEPSIALDGGRGGMEAISTLVDGAAAHLKEGGRLFLEVAPDQAAPVRALMEVAGLGEVLVRRDLAGRDRVISGAKA